jgi:hypothetical protein
MVTCQRFAEAKGPTREGLQAGTVATMTTRQGTSTRSVGEAQELLAFWTRVIADWADRMPLRNVYIFGDYGLNKALQVRKLKIAIEYDETVSADSMRRWQQENSTGCAALETALGVDTQLFTDHDHHVWRSIRDAARAPLMTVRKVRVVHISTRDF